MNTTIESLQAVYVSIGGNLSDVENINTIPDMLDAIAILKDSSIEASVPITSDDIDAIIDSVN